MIEGCKLEDLDDALVISIGQGNVKNGSKSHHVFKEQVKVTGLQMTVTNFAHKDYSLLQKLIL
jgi:hypothetical protein